jgi:hypothetical protein
VEPHRPRGRIVKALANPPPHPIPSPQPVTEAPKQPKEIATSNTARPKKPETKTAAAPKPAAAKPKKKAVAIVETAATKPKTPKLVDPTHFSLDPPEEISDLLDHLHLQACVELTHQLLTSISSLPTGAARPRAVLKKVILLSPNMAARLRTERGKSLRLACWNAD